MKFKPFFDNLFSRWSFNLLVIFPLLLIAGYYLVSFFVINYIFKSTEPSGYGIIWGIYIIFYILSFNVIAFVVYLIYLFIESKTNMRIKNELLLKIFNNIFYKIPAFILAICSIITFLLVSYYYFTSLPIVNDLISEIFRI